MQYIINATSVLKTPQNSKTIELIAKDLILIQKNIPQISEIILGGGAALDTAMGIEPNDIDLMYSYIINGKETSNCMCDQIYKEISKLDLSYFKDKDIDLNNSFEDARCLPPMEVAIGQFSSHCDYISQFAIDKDGEIWTNIDALRDYLYKIYEVRWEGVAVWGFFPHKKDSHNYWAMQVFQIIRGIGYITKRNLIPGERFMRMLSEYKHLITQAVKEIGIDDFQDYAKKKVKTKENFLKFVQAYVPIEEQDNFKKYFKEILTRLD